MQGDSEHALARAPRLREYTGPCKEIQGLHWPMHQDFRIHWPMHQDFEHIRQSTKVQNTLVHACRQKTNWLVHQDSLQECNETQNMHWPMHDDSEQPGSCIQTQNIHCPMLSAQHKPAHAPRRRTLAHAFAHAPRLRTLAHELSHAPGLRTHRSGWYLG